MKLFIQNQITDKEKCFFLCIDVEIKKNILGFYTMYKYFLKKELPNI